ncbi:EF hand domain containing protein [Acanthamoeba castellanii str. Neff]|uniref:EF hand domain containing protein n=1 Tax=Acanthamoeba castellanii (strain ATCC 30010 / Neff) TaxID=1257118 RepID=L8GK26_ACACF|nr:EF hand domain containing protein [Acanthamoeba castellanii str. Neff]ELR13435.1 EF hand domain containing protein [Acanthamoeba castellanii str. Neff]
METTGELERENARLKEEVALLTRALAAFESPTNSKARRIFELFDADQDGLLDEPELRQLAAHLGEEVGGEGWPAGEGWTFDHFYGWWSAPDEQPPASPTPASSPHHPTLAALRAKLRSKHYMRTVFRLVEKASQAPPPQVQTTTDQTNQTNQPSDKGKAKDRGVEGPADAEADELCKIDVKAQVGPFETAACGAVLSYAFSPDDARQYRKQYQAKDKGALVSLYLTIKEGVDDFELGELAGNLRNILLMTKHNYHCADFKIQVVRENGERTFKITLIFEHNSSLEYIQRLDAQLELSEAPLDEASSEFIRARASLSALVHRSAVDFVRAIMSDGEEQRPNGQRSDLIALFSALRDVDLNLRFDDVGDLFRQAFSDAPVADLRGWPTAKVLVAGLLRSGLSKKDEADAVLRSSYANVKKFLRGLDSLRFQIGSNIFQLKCNNLDIIAFLPTVVELGLSGSST